MQQVLATNVNIDKEKAISIARKGRKGVLDRLMAFFYNGSSSEQIEEVYLIYYPYWIIEYNIFISREEISKARVVVDGVEGIAQIIQGSPSPNLMTISKSELVVNRISREIAIKKSIDELSLRLSHQKEKHLREPVLSDVYDIHKPHFVFKCKRGNKQFFKAVDAETGIRNYLLDIRYPKLNFREAIVNEEVNQNESID